MVRKPHRRAALPVDLSLACICVRRLQRKSHSLRCFVITSVFGVIMPFCCDRILAVVIVSLCCGTLLPAVVGNLCGWGFP